MERDAFISYSHKRDVPLADALQKGLHDILRTPLLRRPGVRVFRDTTSLAASHDLSGSIKAALAESRYFIYLASPEAAESRWVREEIRYWRHNHGMKQFLIALSDGHIAWNSTAVDFDWDLTTALPQELRGAFTSEPLWVDLRSFRDSGERSMAPGEPFRDRVASLAAPLHGLPKDALDSEDLRMQRKAVRRLRSFVAGLTVLAIATAGAGLFAWQQRAEALARARTSASQALAARALDTAGKDPRKAAQFALYAQAVKPTGESAQALAQAVVANDSVTRHLQAGHEEVANNHGVAHANATKVAISRDGGMLAYYSDFDPDVARSSSSHIHLYNIRADKALPHLEGGTWPQDGGGMEFSADGRTLAVEEPYNRISIWDVSGRKVLRTITASNGEEMATAFKRLRAFAFSRDGQRVAAAFFSPNEPEYGFHVAVWDATTGRQLVKEPATPNSLTLGFDSSNRLLAFDTQAGTLRTLERDSTSWTAPRKIPGIPHQEMAQATLSADGSTVYLGEQHELWDLNKGQRLAKTNNVDVMSMPDTGDGALYAADGQRVTVYDTALRPQRVLGSFTWPVASISVSGDGRWVASGSRDGAVSLFSTTSFQAGTPLPNSSKITPAELAPDDRTAYRTGKSGTEVWAVTGQGVQKLGRLPLQLVRQPLRVDTVIASLNGVRAIVVQNGALSLWDLRTGSQLGRQSPGSADFEPLGFLPDGIHIVGTTEEEVQIVNTESWDVLQSKPFRRDDGDAAMSLSADRSTLARVAEEKLTVFRWAGPEEGMRQVREISISAMWTMYGHDVVVSAKGERVAVINFDGLISVLDVSTGAFARSTSVSSRESALAFSSDNVFLVQATASGKDSRLQFWDTATGESRGSWTLPKNGTDSDSAIARLLTNDGGTVTALGRDGSLVRRTIDVASWKGVLCSLVPDTLPEEEYNRYLGGLDVEAPCHR
ncbi:toll/interleukin-1 receptor domain-containing protein [Streptomyces sp. NPDC101160]|uniref:toll/interleukin-1 receptor domain-containing protein n=1 Tax=Streptomyces sp. NPDC101160 TaxID=3366118 RepID=UPI0037FC8ABB